MARTRQSKVDDIRTSAGKTSTRKKDPVATADLYPTGSTLLNLACSDNIKGGFKLGTIVTLPGSSSSGKSMLAETAMAEGVYDERFDDYEIIRDDAEAAYSFDTDYLFGSKVSNRVIEPPNGCSNTIQQFKGNILGLTNKDQPVIYTLDSLDSLSSDEELEKEMRKALAMAKSKEAADKISGSYGTEKAKIMGEVLRMINQELERTRSILFIVQQVRQNINAGPFGAKWITSGGQAPFFYSQHQVWLDKLGSLDAKKRKIGTQVRARVKKNKLTGKLRDVNFNIFYDYGIDDLGSMIDFLIEEKLIVEKTVNKKKALHLDELEISGTRPKTTGNAGTLIEQIEEKGLQKKLKRVVAKTWKEIEESIKLDRVPRFGR